LVEGEPRLLLEKNDGTGHVVSGLDLVRAFATLQNLPRLVVLISCQSGGDDSAAGPQPDRAVLSAIGPRLAEAGVPAVLAMQGNLLMPTARRFLPPFFAALQKTGQVDEAVTHGRNAVQDAADAWVPVLYTRLVEGRVWFTKGLTTRAGFNAWQQLAIQINRGKCVPILGSGVLEPFIGTTREVANRLAVANGYPQALSGREDLPQVTQFLETMRAGGAPQVQVPVVMVMAEEVRRRYPALNLGPVSQIDPGNDLRESLTAAWRVYQATRPYEPHRYLAGMRKIKTIINTNPDDILKEALTAVGRPPRVQVCHWDDEGDDSAGGEPARDLADERPDVFHLMGHLSDLDTLVVSEDDYFRFLTANTRRRAQRKDPNRADDLADDLLRGALASSALLFLGFRVIDWDFRSLCRLLLDQKGSNNRNKVHIAVQIDPEDGTHRDAVRARDFIERLFRKLLRLPPDSQVAVYWGSAEDFIEELDQQWKRLQPPPSTPPTVPAAATGGT
jgi:DNA-directed RNA polymerase specialized sigma24 family protein